MTREDLSVFEFNFNDLKMKKLRKNSSFKTKSTNVENFVEWILKTLSDLYEKKDKERYNACSIYMNDNNIEKLHDYLDPVTWLNFSPTNCNDLTDDEYGIDIKTIVEER